MSADFFADIPGFAPGALARGAGPVPAAGALPAVPAPRSAPAGPVRAGGFGRRTFLRTAFAGAGALALSGLTWLGERLPAYARTAPGRSSLHPKACMELDIPGDTPCWGRELIASTYCAEDGQHRTDTVRTPDGTYAYGWEPTCGGYAGWYWKSQGHTINCWDGYVRVRDAHSGRAHYATTSCRNEPGATPAVP
ncbi:hypothetical protein GCM10010123_26500 [Pilimelia anulata]|uniref:Uncharacterized protein n=1 Tax=Pilimelia anulata TaxID=53371 RepID=A0A8J3F9W0_9ACTN|nr:hypothetical protein [Pilimelia anulata]GGJ95409.1 hypothetical protein GCM10010123_26500 [Pilimelia anulata]